MIKKEILEKLYINEKKSTRQIGVILKCKEQKVNYWLAKHRIPKRSISEAVYDYKHPKGDPFTHNLPKNLEEGILYGLGLGLYWGEGQKRGKNGLRITNSDPYVLKNFIRFLELFFKIDKNDLHFSIQVPSSVSIEVAEKYWQDILSIPADQFYKTIKLPSRGIGTYKYKSEYGVVILYFNNTRLKEQICDLIENFR